MVQQLFAALVIAVFLTVAIIGGAFLLFWSLVLLVAVSLMALIIAIKLMCVKAWRFARLA